jgi:hypothetical protein
MSPDFSKEFRMARWMPRKRTILGGTLAVGLGVGLWLSGKLPQMGSGFGLGSGGDGMLGKPDPSEVAASNDQADNSAADHDSEKHTPNLTRTEAEPPVDHLLTILVDGRTYSVWRTSPKSNGYYPADLDELVQLALNAKPNDEGLRVRILRSESARVTAWQKLQSELVQAGVPADEIVLTKDLVP